MKAVVFVLLMLAFALAPIVIGAALLLRDLRFKSQALCVTGTVVSHAPFLHWSARLGRSHELVASYLDGQGAAREVRTGILRPTKKMAEAWLAKRIILHLYPGCPPRVMAASRMYRSGLLMLGTGVFFVAITALILA